ncbi:MAG: hypothetical protein LBP86_08585 [Azoarcus sp.]|jgi:hypothetical protein|nr:hypothetical protein [Azoarcus sp.]
MENHDVTEEGEAPTFWRTKFRGTWAFGFVSMAFPAALLSWGPPAMIQGRIAQRAAYRAWVREEEEIARSAAGARTLCRLDGYAPSGEKAAPDEGDA